MFTDEQKSALAAKLDRQDVKTRGQAGRQLSYIEGWVAIAEANRIFGFDGWTSETVDLRCVSERERKIGQAGRDGWGVSYIARVRVTVFAGDTLVTRDGVGAGHGIDVDLGLAHESAIKEGETDARKRALMTFGNPFGLALYDKDQTNVENAGVVPAAVANGRPSPGPVATASPSEELESKRMFLQGCKAFIVRSSADDVKAWWQSEEQSKARRTHELTQVEVDELKALVIAKVNPRAA